ncbi:PorV/PorQ family protein [candidate division KSB1 bacterium]|nr:PorV/PorQ family protein [candidate division KSB1 bacterium]
MKRLSNCLSLIFAWMILSSNLVYSQGAQDVESIDRVGTTAAQFLKIGAGARPIAMGSAYTALSEDILSIYWNPAGLSRVGGSGEATFNHAEWLADTQYDFAAFSLNAGNIGSVGFQVISFRTPEQPVRTIRNPEGTGQVWSANSISFGITFAKSLTDRFSVGVTGKFVQESIFNETARGGAFDIGVLYNTPFENLTLGASITNFGTKMELDGRDIFFNEDPLPDQGSVEQVPAKFRTESFDMPLNLRFGLAWQVVRSEEVSIVAAADGANPNDNAQSVNSGFEIGLKNILFLRGGYKTLFLDDSEEGATFGVGLRYDVVGTNLKFDFGWADFGRLQDVKFVSFAIRY